MAETDIVNPSVDILSLINHPVRVDIIKLVYSEPISFTDLSKHLSIESTNKLSFHLNKLVDLVEISEGGKYKLTKLGIETFHSLIASEKDNLSGEPVSISKENERVKLSTIENFFNNLNPSVLIIILAFLTNLIIVTIFDNFLSDFIENSNRSVIESLTVWLIVYNIPVILYFIICFYYRFPFKYAMVGGFITLFISFFYLKNPINVLSNTSGIPTENLSQFLTNGIMIFPDIIRSTEIQFTETLTLKYEPPLFFGLNMIFLYALIVFCSIFIILLYPLRWISCKNNQKLFMTQENSLVGKNSLWKRKTWILLGLIGAILTSFLLNNVLLINPISLIILSFSLNNSFIILFTLVISCIVYLHLIYPLIIISHEKNQEITTNYQYIPIWMKLFWKPKTWIICGSLYAILAILFGELKSALIGTIMYQELRRITHENSSGITQDIIEMNHFIIPPLGYLVPQLSFIILIALTIHLILNINRIPSQLKNFICTLGILLLPFIHLVDYMNHYHTFDYYVYNYAREKYGIQPLDSLPNNIDVFITGVNEYYLVRLIHLCFEIIVITATLAILIKFISWGLEFKRNYINKSQIKQNKKVLKRETQY